MVRVKICGITNRADAFAAVDAGADALGFVFHSPSPRCVAPATVRSITLSLPPMVTTVGVCVGGRPRDLKALASACGLGLLQVHGAVPRNLLAGVRPFRVIHAVRVRSRADLGVLRGSRASLLLADAWVDGLQGGTGTRLDPRLLAGVRLPAPLILAGGLAPDCVAAAVRRVRPWGVDVSTGVELRPGRKDRARMFRFVREAKCA